MMILADLTATFEHDAEDGYYQERYKHENAAFRNDAGLQCYINRYTDGKCCDWCDKIAGRYDYATAPQDVFRRHDNCGCRAIYECGNTRQDIWSKQSWTAVDSDASDKAVNYTPPKLTTEQANAIEQEKLSQFRSLTGDRDSGIIKKTTKKRVINFAEAFGLPPDYADVINEKVSAIPEPILKDLIQYVSKISIVENRGFSSYNPLTREIILDNVGLSIIHELGHAFGDMEKLYDNKHFLTILSEGLNLNDWGEVLPYPHPYKKDEYVYILSSEKFVDSYQCRIYSDISVLDWNKPIDAKMLKEYISVGFETYITNSSFLKAKDTPLYNYLEELFNERIKR